MNKIAIKISRSLLYRLYGLSPFLFLILFFFFVKRADDVSLYFLFVLLFFGFLCYLTDFVILSLERIALGDRTNCDIRKSILQGTWKQDYNSPYESALSFLLYDPVCSGKQIRYNHCMSLVGYLLPRIYTRGGNTEWKITKEYPDVKIRIMDNVIEFSYCGKVRQID